MQQDFPAQGARSTKFFRIVALSLPASRVLVPEGRSRCAVTMSSHTAPPRREQTWSVQVRHQKYDSPFPWFDDLKFDGITAGTSTASFRRREARTRMAAGEAIPPSNFLTGPASYGRLVCAPARRRFSFFRGPALCWRAKRCFQHYRE